MKPLTDLDKLKEVLLNQAERGIRRGDWDALEYTERHSGHVRIVLRVPVISVDFVFTGKGRLLGASNYRE